MLHGEYGGEEGKLVPEMKNLLYGYDYVFDACKQKGLSFHLESLPQVVVYQLMAILLLHFELLIVCLEKEYFGELANQLL